MKKWLALIGLAFTLSAQAQNVTISGYIRDAATGEEFFKNCADNARTIPL